MYVNSVGFFDQMNSLIASVPSGNKHTVIGRLWKMYQYLMQYCCPTDFQMIAEKMMEDQVNAIKKVKDEFEQYKKDFDQQNEDVMERLLENERNYYRVQ